MHLIFEDSSNLFWINSSEQCVKTTDEGVTVSNYGIGGSTYIKGAWLDRSTHKLWSCQYSNGEAVLYYLSLTNEADYQGWGLVQTANAGYDAFYVNSLWHMIFARETGGHVYLKIYDGYNNTTRLNQDMGVTGVSYDCSLVFITGNLVYFLWKYSTDDVKLYSFNGVTFALTELYQFTNTNLSTSKNQQGIAYDGSDMLYYVLKDTSDNKMYLWTYSISGDSATKGSEYNIMLMLDRNTNSANDPPFNLEKGFGVGTDHDGNANTLMVYQIAKNAMNLWKIADLTNALSGYTIVAITDTYLIVRLTAAPNTTKLLKYESMASAVVECEIEHAERDFPTADLTYDSNVFQIKKHMFLQCIGKVVVAGVLQDPGVRFEGFVDSIEDIDEENPRIKIAHLVSPAADDLMDCFAGDATGDSDEHATAIVESTHYVKAGTISDGSALGTITYSGGVINIVLLNALTAFDQFSWALRPTGELDFDDGTVDSGVDYDDASSPYAHNCEVEKQEKLYNYIWVEGAYINGALIECATAGEDPQAQNEVGVIPITIQIPFCDESGYADSWATALLALLGSEITDVQFDIYDATNGMICPNQEITLEFTDQTTYRNFTAAQFKINSVLFDDIKGEATYFVSSAIHYEPEEFEKQFDSNAENIDQIAGTVVTNAGTVTTHTALTTTAHGGFNYFVWRTGADATDYSIGSGLTASGAWRTGVNALNISAIVPAGTVAVLLTVSITDASAGQIVAFRKDATDTRSSNLRTQVANIAFRGIQIVGVSSQKIDYYIDSGVDAVTVQILGWWRT